MTKAVVLPSDSEPGHAVSGMSGFPWAAGRPKNLQRLGVAALISALAAATTAAEYAGSPGHHSDFGLAWFGARALLAGENPWNLVGPGLEFDWSWLLLYPGPALVLAMPLSFLPEMFAASAFIFLSTFLLAWGSTRYSWHRLPAFASLPFLVASSAGQWSAVLASAWFFPAVAGVWLAKPTIGLALLLSRGTRRHLIGFAIGGGALVLLSFAFQSSWISSWAGTLGGTTHMTPPIASWGGFAVAAALLRWRRPEARLLFLLACVPQSPAVYDLLILLVLIPETYYEAIILSLFCSLGLLLFQAAPIGNEQEFVSVRGMINVVSCYLPATILVLRRPNESPA